MANKNTTKQISLLTLYFIITHIINMLMMSICRLILLFGNFPEEGIDGELLISSQFIGLQFDNLIACYIAFFPYIAVAIIGLSTMHKANFSLLMQRTLTVTKWWFYIIYAFVLFTLVANARYFHFFENHLNISVTEWFGFGETAGLIFGDGTNLIYLAIAIVIIFVYIISIRLVTNRFRNKWEATVPHKTSYVYSSLIVIVAATICVIGMRGSLQRYPLQVGYAYFCDKPFYNKLGISPIFNIIKSLRFKDVNELPELPMSMDEQSSLKYIQEELSYTPTDNKYPLTRKISHDSIMPTRPNIVLVLMESMSSDNLKREYDGQPLTPYLRSLCDKAIYFSNCYSTGVHTNNGIVGTMYGYAPNFSQTCMTTTPDSYTGIPYWLKNNGYETMCFVTGDPHYDNMNEFWRDNCISEIYSLNDYPKEMAVNCFGVQDDYLFKFGLDKLSECSKKGNPFMATFLTVSNHGPYRVPNNFIGRGSTNEERIIAFADDALEKFVETAKATEWGQNTIFLLIADHGYPNGPGSIYEMPLGYNKICAFVYSDLISPRIIDDPVSQMDIYPTILSILGIDFENNCLGINVLNEKRRYAVFTNNDHLGCSDGNYFYCYDIYTQKENLYKLGDAKNIIDQEPERANDMRTYACNMIYVNNMAIRKKWTEPKRK